MFSHTPHSLTSLFLLFSSDDVDYRSSHTNIAQASSSVPFAPPQMPVSASMPWLGSGQTSMGASVVRASHSTLTLYKPNTLKPETCSSRNSQQGETELSSDAEAASTYSRATTCSGHMTRPARFRECIFLILIAVGPNGAAPTKQLSC